MNSTRPRQQGQGYPTDLPPTEQDPTGSEVLLWPRTCPHPCSFRLNCLIQCLSLPQLMGCELVSYPGGTDGVLRSHASALSSPVEVSEITMSAS